MNKEFTKRLNKIEKELNSILPKSIEEDWMANSFSVLPKAVTAEHSANLLTPCRELMLRGGKRWRPLLSVLSCELLQGKPKDIYPLTPLIELCHTASLIHDDIEDNSDERRGAPAIHLKYGVDAAINSGSWLYFQAMTTLLSYSRSARLNSTLYKMYALNLRRLHLGQAMDISWHADDDYIPTKEEYLAMINLKTGSLARLAGELGAIATGCSERQAVKYGELMAQMGVSFQILDDVKNLSGKIKGKVQGDDIVEGKKSLPVILYLKKRPKSKQKILDLFERAKTEGVSSPAINEFIDLISSSTALNDAKKMADKIRASVLKKLEKKYPKSEARDLMFELFEDLLKI